jgi:hypothetical protein
MSQAVRSAKTKLIVFLVTIFIISLTAVIIIASNYDVTKDSFGRSVTDALLTLISASAIGTMITLLLNNYNREQEKLADDYNRLQAKISENENRERAKLDKAAEERQMQEENRNQYRKEVLANLNHLYAKTKTARRMLRAKGFTTQWYGSEDDSRLVKQSVYDLYMNDINQCQLGLEAIRKEIFIGNSIFLDPAMIAGNLKQMDDYLGKLISEYEKKLPCFKGEPEVLKMEDLPDLKQFLSKAKVPGGFKENFSRKCEVITINIRNEINFISPGKAIEIQNFDDDAEE